MSIEKLLKQLAANPNNVRFGDLTRAAEAVGTGLCGRAGVTTFTGTLAYPRN